MPGFNLTGDPNVNDYNLGRGKLYLAELTAAGLPDDNGFRDLGNCPQFNVTIDTETLEHQSSREGTKIIDKEVVVQQSMEVSFQLDEINFQNLALFMSGDAQDAAYTNPAIAGVAETTLITSAPDLSATGARHYQLKTAAGVRIYDIQASNLTMNSDTAGADNLLVEGVDYEVQEKQGTVKLLAGSTLIDPGDDVTFTLAADAGAENPDRVQALTKTNVLAALLFVAENPANNDAETEYLFHQVQLKADGDYSLIGDEWTVMGFTAKVEKSPASVNAASPYVDVVTHAAA